MRSITLIVPQSISLESIGGFVRNDIGGSFFGAEGELEFQVLIDKFRVTIEELTPSEAVFEEYQSDKSFPKDLIDVTSPTSRFYSLDYTNSELLTDVVFSILKATNMSPEPIWLQNDYGEFISGRQLYEILTNHHWFDWSGENLEDRISQIT